MRPPVQNPRRPAFGKSLFIQGTGFGLGLAVHMLLSRWLGPASYGDISVTLSVAQLAASFAALGFSRFSIQPVAQLGAANEGRAATSFARCALLTVTASTLAVSVLLYVGTRAAEMLFDVDEHPIRYGALLVLPITFAPLLGGLLSGLRRPLLAQALNQFSGRALLLAGLVGLLFTAIPPSEELALELLTTTLVLPPVLLALSLRQNWPAEWTPASPPGDQWRAWRATARSYLVASLPMAALAQSGIFLMELFHGNEGDVGTYAAAHRTAGLFFVVLAATRQLAVPELSAAKSEGPQALEDRLRSNLRFMFGTGGALWLLFALLGDEILTLFGHSTEKGHRLLILLATASLIYLVTGLAKPVLQLFGHHRLVIGSMMMLLGLTLLAGAMVIPVWGGEGLAAAQILVNLCVLGYLMRQVQRRTGLRYLSLLWSRPTP